MTHPDQTTPTAEERARYIVYNCLGHYPSAILRHATEQIRATEQAAREEERGRRFPIQGGPSIPWAMIAPYEDQAQRNHSQSLERLAQRAGLSPFEAVRVLRCQSCSDWSNLDKDKELAALEEMRREFEGKAARRAALEEMADALDNEHYAGAGAFVRARAKEKYDGV